MLLELGYISYIEVGGLLQCFSILDFFLKYFTVLPFWASNINTYSKRSEGKCLWDYERLIRKKTNVKRLLEDTVFPQENTLKVQCEKIAACHGEVVECNQTNSTSLTPSSPSLVGELCCLPVTKC